VRVSSNRSLGGFGGLELNECAVLYQVSFEDSVTVEDPILPSGG
jgi:hypothetical protein